MPEVVNLAEKFALFAAHGRPRSVGELNGQQIKLAWLKGACIWHHHATAELLLVIHGTLPKGEAQ